MDSHDSPGQCANLWWPADRAWCVASEIARGEAPVTKPRGTVGGQLRRPGRLRRGELRIQTTSAMDGYSGGAGSSPLDAGADLRSELTIPLTLALLDLASM